MAKTQDGGMTTNATGTFFFFFEQTELQRAVAGQLNDGCDIKDSTLPTSTDAFLSLFQGMEKCFVALQALTLVS